MKVVKALAVVVGVAAVVLVARVLPPAPDPVAGLELSSASDGGSGGVDPDAVLTTAPTDAGSPGPTADPFAPLLIDPAVPTAAGTVGQGLAFDVPDPEQVTMVVTTARAPGSA